jgi:hypothetical protein
LMMAFAGFISMADQRLRIPSPKKDADPLTSESTVLAPAE